MSKRVLFWNSPLLCILVIVGVLQELSAQDTLPIQTRIEQIQAERRQKAADLVPDEPPPLERRFAKIQNMARRAFTGSPLRIQFGGLPGGSGLAVGPLLEWKSSSDLTWRLGGVASLRRSYGFRGGAVKRSPSVSLTTGVDAAYINGAKLDYYGPGPNSSEDDRTDFRREETTVDFSMQWDPPRRPIRIGVNAGPLFVNVGPGVDDSLPSTESVFGPAEAPGIDEQTNFITAGAVIDFDYRDLPLNPHAGGLVTVGYRRYHDIKLHRYTFDRLFVEAEHFVPLLNKKRVLAFRAATQLSFHEDDQLVPFYLQPTLGGPKDLRGFRRYRFYDDNSILFNAEYRWEVSTGFTLAVFGDAGQVFDSTDQITWSNLRSDAGFGLRFSAPKRIALRIDTGFSQEGFMTWLQVTGAF